MSTKRERILTKPRAEAKDEIIYVRNSEAHLHPEIKPFIGSYRAARGWAQERHKRGMAHCYARIAGRWYIDLHAFREWVRSQSSENAA